MQPDLLFEPLPPADPLRRVLVIVARLAAGAMAGATAAMLWRTLPAILKFLDIQPPEAGPETTYLLIPSLALAALLFLYRQRIAAVLHRTDD